VIDGGVTTQALVVRWYAPERGLTISGLNVLNLVYEETDPFAVKDGSIALSNSALNDTSDFVSSSNFEFSSLSTWMVNPDAVSGSQVTASGVVTTYATNGDIESTQTRNIRYEVRLSFTMAKVAPSSGVWNVGVLVQDRLQLEISEPRSNLLEQHALFASSFYENQWYGEVEVLSNNLISFTDVEAGSGFQQADQRGVQSGIQVRFISNGSYQQKVQSDTTWRPATVIPGRPAFAYLVFDSGLTINLNSLEDRIILENEGNRFAMQARRIQLGDTANEGDFINIVPYAPFDPTSGLVPSSTSSIYQQLDGNNAPIGNPIISYSSVIATAPITAEGGVISIFEFQLRTSEVYQNSLYRGTMAIGVSNAVLGSVTYND